MMIGSSLSAVTGFHGGSAPPPSPTTFTQKLVMDHQTQKIMQDLTNFNLSDHDFSFGFSYEGGDDQSQGLVFGAPAEVNKDESPKRRRLSPEIDDPRERKKLTDKRYREKVKTEKELMKQQLDDVKAEKGSLIKVIEQLRGENAKMKQTLDSSSERMTELSSSHNNLKREFSRQESTVKALMSKLSPETDMTIMKQQEESEMLLRLKEAIYRQDMEEVCHIFETLMNENMKLKKENMIHQVNMEALCEKIENDKHLK